MSIATKIWFFLPLVLNTLAESSGLPSHVDAIDPEEAARTTYEYSRQF
jgi:hypothetical protein